MNDAGELFRSMKRHRWTVIACGTLLAAAGWGLGVITPPVYEASVRLEIRKPAQRTAWSEQALGASSAQVENLNLYTFAELIKRRGLLARLAGELVSSGAWATLSRQGMAGPPWVGEAQARVASVAPPGEGEAHDAAEPSEVDARVLELASMITVRPVKDTRLVDVVVQCGEPELARTVADRLATLFVDDQRQRASEADTAGFATLDRELAEARQRMNEREASAQLAGSMDAQLLDARRSRLTLAMAQLDQDRQHADGAVQEASARLARLERYETAPDTELWQPCGDVSLDALHQDLLGCARRLAAARAIYRPMHPTLVALESQCAELRALEQRSLPGAVRALRAQVGLEQSRTAQLHSAMADSERALGAIEARRAASGGAAALAQGDRDLESRLLDRMRDRLLEAPLEPPPVDRVDAAMVAPDPVRPRRALNVLVGLVAGLLLGTGWALLRGPGLPVFERPDQLEAELELPVIAVLTEHAGEGRS